MCGFPYQHSPLTPPRSPPLPLATHTHGLKGILLRCPESAASCLILATGSSKMAETLGKEKRLLKVLQGST